MVRVYPAIGPGIGIRGTREEKVDAASGKTWQQFQGITLGYTLIEKFGQHLVITCDLYAEYLKPLSGQ
jgi:hypothetical protein